MFKFKLVNRQKCLDNMKVNGFSCTPKLGDSAGDRYRSVKEDIRIISSDAESSSSQVGGTVAPVVGDEGSLYKTTTQYFEK